MAKKYVIVGANKNTVYNNPDDEIAGAKKSALDWKTFLDSNGFKNGVYLTDENASRENILGELAKLFGSLLKDDFAVFIYIGHGRQLGIDDKDYDVTKDETDYQDEALMCNGREIYDDEIRKVLNLNRHKAPVFVLIDSCYNPVIEQKGVALNRFSSYNEVAFSSTSANDKAFMQNHKGEKQAVYSSFLLEVLAVNLNKNYNEIFDLADSKLKASAKSYPQTPQLAFTNYAALKNIVFTSPIKTEIRFSEEEIAKIIVNPFKSQTGIQKNGQLEKLAAFIHKHSTKFNNK